MTAPERDERGATPLTDAKVALQRERAMDGLKLLAENIVDADFARQLERDRARLIDALDAIRKFPDMEANRGMTFSDAVNEMHLMACRAIASVA